MTTPSLTLFHARGACSQVCRVALEEAALPYELQILDFAAGDQSQPAYARISPLGKVPLLLVDGELLSENGAIQLFIAALRPDAGLFPIPASEFELARRHSGLFFCSATLHPIVRGLFNPGRLTDGDTEGVRSRSAVLAQKNFAFAESRLEASDWWLGPWSMIDVYLAWAVSIARRGGFDLAPFPRLDGLHDRLLDRPTYRRVIEDDLKPVPTTS